MKTSLVIDDQVFREAKKEASNSGKTISEVISLWARVGRDLWKKRSRLKGQEFKALNLGSTQLDLSNRKRWMEVLEEKRSKK